MFDFMGAKSLIQVPLSAWALFNALQMSLIVAMDDSTKRGGWLMLEHFTIVLSGTNFACLKYMSTFVKSMQSAFMIKTRKWLLMFVS